MRPRTPPAAGPPPGSLAQELRCYWHYVLADARPMPTLSAAGKAWLGPAAPRSRPVCQALVLPVQVPARLAVAAVQPPSYSSTHYAYSADEARAWLPTQLPLAGRVGAGRQWLPPG
ncbi:MAG: hypothetical protein EOO59_10925 [Hymenobacter sp.]|nr:MAG: hypothetical protein EOO59_10925 [Hymenobacter sp.]